MTDDAWRGRSNNFTVIEDVPVNILGDQKTIPAGSFVRPVEDCYVPKHCFDTMNGRRHMPTRDIFVYCKLGLVSIPKSVIRVT